MLKVIGIMTKGQYWTSEWLCILSTEYKLDLMEREQGISQDQETVCPKLAIVTCMGVLFFKGGCGVVMFYIVQTCRMPIRHNLSFAEWILTVSRLPMASKQ